jgi:hypothetical protein
MTSLPIPSAGMSPILRVFLAAVAKGRKAMVIVRVVYHKMENGHVVSSRV